MSSVTRFSGCPKGGTHIWRFSQCVKCKVSEPVKKTSSDNTRPSLLPKPAKAELAAKETLKRDIEVSNREKKLLQEQLQQQRVQHEQNVAALEADLDVLHKQHAKDLQAAKAAGVQLGSCKLQNEQEVSADLRQKLENAKATQHSLVMEMDNMRVQLSGFEQRALAAEAALLVSQQASAEAQAAADSSFAKMDEMEARVLEAEIQAAEAVLTINASEEARLEHEAAAATLHKTVKGVKAAQEAEVRSRQQSCAKDLVSKLANIEKEKTESHREFSQLRRHQRATEDAQLWAQLAVQQAERRDVVFSANKALQVADLVELTTDLKRDLAEARVTISNGEAMRRKLSSELEAARVELALAKAEAT